MGAVLFLTGDGDGVASEICRVAQESRMVAGILLVVLPTVMYGGLSLLMFLTRGVPGGSSRR